jgi:hypothetical protein
MEVSRACPDAGHQVLSTICLGLLVVCADTGHLLHEQTMQGQADHGSSVD